MIFLHKSFNPDEGRRLKFGKNGAAGTQAFPSSSRSQLRLVGTDRAGGTVCFMADAVALKTQKG